MRTLFLAALLLGLGIFPAAAQPVQPVLHVNGAAGFPLAPSSFSSVHGIGYGAALGGGINVLDRADLFLEGSFASFPVDRDPFAGSDLEPAGGDISLAGAAIGLRVHFPTPSGTIYVSPSGSMVRYKVADLTIEGSDTTFSEIGTSEWAPAAAIGAGVTFDLAPQVALFVEADYTVVFAEQRTLRYTPVRVGVILRPLRSEE